MVKWDYIHIIMWDFALWYLWPSKQMDEQINKKMIDFNKKVKRQKIHK